MYASEKLGTLLTSFIGLALYRALLRRCSPTRSNNNAPWVSQIKSLAKSRFRRYKNLQSPSQVQNALKAGYQVCLPEPPIYVFASIDS